jgi:phosphoglycolate phosphatase
MIRSQPYELIIFDWDGTLVDSPYKIVECLARAAEATHTPFDREAGRSIIGLSLELAIRQLYPEKSMREVNDFLLAYREAFFSCQEQSPLFSATRDLLRWLKDEQQLDLAVATGKSRSGLERELDQYQLRSWFTVTRTSDETASKPNPLMVEEILDFMQVSPERALVVGDTDYDLLMAGNANVDALGLSCGAHPIERLERASPEAILPDIGHLQAWLIERAQQESAPTQSSFESGRLNP